MTTLGILGSGQLGRMLALAAHDLAIPCAIYAPADGCATEVVRAHAISPWDDDEALDLFAGSVDVATYELEQLPLAAVERMARRVPVFPPPNALAALQDRLHERELLQEVGVPFAPFARADGHADLDRIEAAAGYPCLVKSRREGYDGKAQVRCATRAELAAALDALEAPAIAEAVVDFAREVSVVAVRDHGGHVAFYAPVENHHAEGILRWSRAPAPGLAPAARATIEGYARAILDALDYVGVVAIELFETADGWLVNEMAPRVHNSGHWTIEGAVTSQFHNHVRAVLGLPLGSTALRGEAGMVNLIGEAPPLERLLDVPGAYVHLYGKTPRPGRKLGHVTVVGDDGAEVETRLERLRALAGAS